MIYKFRYYTARRAHKTELQRSNPNGPQTWLAHRTVSGGAPDCPVRHATAAFQQPLCGGPLPIPHKALVISERDLLCSFKLLRLDCFLLSFFLAIISIVIKARDTKCVVVLAGSLVPN
jgi:hypothetical protein